VTRRSELEPHPHITATYSPEKVGDSADGRRRLDIQLIGGGCKVSDQTGDLPFLVKSFPIEDTNGVQAWKCSFGSHGSTGGGVANAMALGASAARLPIR